MISSGHTPRAPGLTLAALCAALFALIAILALTTRLNPPPTVSELAPQANRQITESVGDLGSSSSGFGPGDLGESRPSSSGSPIEVSRVLKCIGEPPRQIEDPQSPPCVPYWKGNNAGTTWRGVTGNEIRVAVGNFLRVQDGGAGADAESFDGFIKIYETFFNRRFQLYGRKLKLIPFTPARSAATAVEMKNDAIRVDKELGAFAATQYTEQDGRHYVFFDALADRKVLSVVTGPGGLSRNEEGHLSRFAPYQWDYTPSADRFFRGYGEFICNVLADKPPIYAGPPESQSPKRVFGIIIDTGFRDTPAFDMKPLEDAMSACNAPLVKVEWDQALSVATPLLALRDRDVSDVMYTGQGGLLALRIMPQASAQGYHPEWLIWNLGYQDSDALAQFFPKSEIPHILGTQVFNKALRPEDMPHVWAAKEVDPTSSPIGDEYERLYKSLLLLASGVQMAGPELTPTAFERGLMRTEFPNPGASGPPYYQARVGFPGVHTMQQDMTMVWLNASERSPTTGLTPAFCYVQRGRRYGLGQWPKEPIEFFSGPCR